MNKWAFLLLTFSIRLSTSVNSVASGLEGQNYFGIGASSLKYNEDPVTTHHTALTLKVGHEMNDFLAVEGRLSLGLGEDKVEDVIDFDFEIDYLVGMYFRGNLPIGGSPRVRAYGLVGFTRGKFTARAFGFSSSDSETDIGYGLGLELFGNNKNAINLEFMRSLDVDSDYEFTVDSVTIAYINRF
jgi:hypothetical protein